jgi:DNA-binding GntR family transcriptional regulator
MAGRPFVWQIITGAKAQLDRVRFLSLHEPGWSDMILSQHAAIAERVAARDVDGAAAIMQTHLRTAFAAIDRIAIEHAEFFDGADQI